MPDALDLLLQELLAGQTRMEARIIAIETALAEKRGERKVVLGAWGLASGAVGAALVAFVKAFFAKHGS